MTLAARVPRQRLAAMTGRRLGILLAIGLTAATPVAATQDIEAASGSAAPATPAPFVADPAPTPATGESFVTIPPVSLAETGWSQRRIRFRDAAVAALADRDFQLYTLAGVGLIFLAAFVRRRRRRQIGWGVLPDRQGRA